MNHQSSHFIHFSSQTFEKQKLLFPQKVQKNSEQNNKYSQISQKEQDQKIIKNKVQFQTLIQYHKIYGNKWKIISKYLPGTSDSFLKNMFYTFTRKSIRKLNTYIQFSSNMRKNKTKPFKLNFVFKLANLSESQRMSEFYQQQKSIYSQLLYDLLEIGKYETLIYKNLALSSQLFDDDQQYKKSNIEILIFNLKTIQKIFIEQNLIKKGRTKKKFPKKGLVQKANTSKAFRKYFNSKWLEQFNIFFKDNYTQQSKNFYNEISQNFDLQAPCQIPFLNFGIDTQKSIVDTCLDEKYFDPLLFN